MKFFDWNLSHLEPFDTPSNRGVLDICKYISQTLGNCQDRIVNINDNA